MMKSYLAAYETDDSHSTKACETVLLFGEPTVQNKENISTFQ